jgi:ParB family transcriptional regulator, chromosome partitioning protein
MKKQIREIDLLMIHPNRRIACHEESIDRICRSFQSGVRIEPIEIFFNGERFEIIDGEKRWRACKKLGLKSIKAIIVETRTVVEINDPV